MAMTTLPVNAMPTNAARTTIDQKRLALAREGPAQRVKNIDAGRQIIGVLFPVSLGEFHEQRREDNRRNCHCRPEDRQNVEIPAKALDEKIGKSGACGLHAHQLCKFHADQAQKMLVAADCVKFLYHLVCVAFGAFLRALREPGRRGSEIGDHGADQDEYRTTDADNGIA